MSSICLLRIVIRRGARYQHHAVTLDLLLRARKMGLAGATMLEVVEGFGSSHRTRLAGRWALSDAVAYELLLVDTEEKLTRFAEEVGPEIGPRGLVIRQPASLVGGWIGLPDR